MEIIPTQEMEPQEEIHNTTGSEPLYILPSVLYLQSYSFRPTTVHLSTLSSGMTYIEISREKTKYKAQHFSINHFTISRN